MKTMKRFAGLLVVLVLLCTVLATAAFASTPTVTVNWEVINNGTQLKATINLPSDTALGAAAVRLTYNADKLTPNQSSSNQGICTVFNFGSGFVHSNFFDTEGVTGGVLSTVVFDIEGVISSSDYGFDMSKTSISDTSIPPKKIAGASFVNSDLYCPHYYGDWTTDDAPDCVNAGEKSRVCSVCGDKDTETLVATGEHDYTVETLVTEADCENAAVYDKACSVCKALSGKTYESGEPKGHTPEVVPGYAAECGKTGLTDGEKCAVCGKELKIQKEIEALKHTGGTATCTEKAVCDLCKQPYGEFKAHAYGEPKFNWSEDGTSATYTATCTTCTTETITDNAKVEQTAGDKGDCKTQGTYTYTATAVVDGTTYTDTKTVTGAYGKHDVGNKPVMPTKATCIAVGNEEYWHCSVCQKNFKEEACTTEIADVVVPIDATNHVEWEWIEGYEQTCTEEGMMDYWTCSACGYMSVDEEGELNVGNLSELKIEADPYHHVLCWYEAFEGTCLVPGHDGFIYCEECLTWWTIPEGLTYEDLDSEKFSQTMLGESAGVLAKDGEIPEKLIDDDVNSENHVCYESDENGHWTTCGDENGEVQEHKFNEETVGNKKVYTCATCEYSYYKTISTGGATSPKTGDEANIALWAILFLVSGAGIMVLSRKKEN